VCGFGHGLPPRCAVAQKSLEDTALEQHYVDVIMAKRQKHVRVQVKMSTFCPLDGKKCGFSLGFNYFIINILKIPNFYVSSTIRWHYSYLNFLFIAFKVIKSRVHRNFKVKLTHYLKFITPIKNIHNKLPAIKSNKNKIPKIPL